MVFARVEGKAPGEMGPGLEISHSEKVVLSCLPQDKFARKGNFLG